MAKGKPCSCAERPDSKCGRNSGDDPPDTSTVRESAEEGKGSAVERADGVEASCCRAAAAVTVECRVSIWISLSHGSKDLIADSRRSRGETDTLMGVHSGKSGRFLSVVWAGSIRATPAAVANAMSAAHCAERREQANRNIQFGNET